MKLLNVLALILVIVGGLNWGLVAFLELDLVAVLFGEMTVVAKSVYGLVALAAIYSISLLVKELK